MPRCPHTNVTIPECSCQHCVRRQFERFAPENLVLRSRHDPLSLRDVRPAVMERPSVSERLQRPAI